MIATQPPPVTAPPTAPEVSQQQGPISRFIQQQDPTGGQGQGQDAANFSAMGLVEQRLNQVALLMRDVAKVLVTAKPELMPVWEKMMQAGTMLLGEVQKAGGGQQQGPPQGAPPAQQEQEPGSDQGQGMPAIA